MNKLFTTVAKSVGVAMIAMTAMSASAANQLTPVFNDDWQTSFTLNQSSYADVSFPAGEVVFTFNPGLAAGTTGVRYRTTALDVSGEIPVQDAAPYAATNTQTDSNGLITEMTYNLPDNGNYYIYYNTGSDANEVEVTINCEPFCQRVDFTLGQPMDITKFTYAVFTPETSGTLTLTMNSDLVKGSNVAGFQYLVFTQVTLAGQATGVAGLPAGRPDPTQVLREGTDYIDYQTYELIGGTRYYIAYNGDVTLTPTFDSGADPREEATEFTLPGTVAMDGESKYATFTVESAGVLTVVTQAQVGAMNLNANALIQTASAQPVASTVAPSQGYIGWVSDLQAGTYTAYFELEEPGQYYVYYNNDTPASFDFSFVAYDDIQVTLDKVEPFEPGFILDTAQTELGNGIKLTFFPSGTLVGDAYLYYVVDGETQSTQLTVEDLHGGSYNIGGSDGEIYKLMASIDKDTEIKLVVNDVNYGDIPLMASSLNNEFISIEDGTLTLTYFSEPSVPFTLTSQEWPEKLVPYPNIGGEYSTATLTFSYPVAKLTATLLFYSNYILQSQVEVPGQVDIPASIDGNVVTLNFGGIDLTQVEGYTPLSSYSIVVQGIFAENGLKCDSFVKDLPYDANYVAEEQPEMSEEATAIDLLEEVADPQPVVVTWNYQEISLVSATAQATLRIDDNEITYACNLTEMKVEVDGEMPEYNNAIEIALPENVQLGEGLYTFTLPAGVVENTAGEVNAEATFSYTVVTESDAINSINTAEGETVIYNLQGVKLNKPVKGINIINGKKVLVK